MRRSWFPALVVGVALGSSAFAAAVDVILVNESDWDIHQLFLSPTSDDEWGPDQLGEHVVEADGGRFTLTGVPCAEYDVKLVDEDGDECVVPEVAICGADEKWILTNEDLLACEFSG